MTDNETTYKTIREEKKDFVAPVLSGGTFLTELDEGDSYGEEEENPVDIEEELKGELDAWKGFADKIVRHIEEERTMYSRKERHHLNEIENLRSSKDECEDECEKLKKNLQLYEDECEKLKKNLQLYEDEIGTLRAQISQLQSQLEDERIEKKKAVSAAKKSAKEENSRVHEKGKMVVKATISAKGRELDDANSRVERLKYSLQFQLDKTKKLENELKHERDNRRKFEKQNKELISENEEIRYEMMQELFELQKKVDEEKKKFSKLMQAQGHS